VDEVIDWKLIELLVERSYRTVANKRLLKAQVRRQYRRIAPPNDRRRR
jgi:hypothetical protein